MYVIKIFLGQACGTGMYPQNCRTNTDPVVVRLDAVQKLGLGKKLLWASQWAREKVVAVEPEPLPSTHDVAAATTQLR